MLDESCRVVKFVKSKWKITYDSHVACVENTGLKVTLRVSLKTGFKLRIRRNFIDHERHK